jgi:hypothetical protein
MNFVDPYIKAVVGFVGITDVRTLPAGGVTSSRPARSIALLCLDPHWNRYAPAPPEAKIFT